MEATQHENPLNHAGYPKRVRLFAKEPPSSGSERRLVGRLMQALHFCRTISPCAGATEMKTKSKPKSYGPSNAAACSRILVTLAITDPEVVADYKNTCDELVWEDLVNGELINFAEFISRENATEHPTT